MGFFKRISTVFKTNVNAALDEAEDSDKISNRITDDIPEQLVTTKPQITTHLSQKDSIERLNLTEDSFNALTSAGVQTIGEVLKLVELDELQTIPTLGQKSILEIKIQLAQVTVLNDSEVEANTDAIPDQSDTSLSPEDSTEKPSLSQYSPNLPKPTDSQKIEEVGQQIESDKLPTTSKIEGNTKAIPAPNYAHLSQEDPIGQLNLRNRSFNALTRAGIRTVGEVLQLIESGGLQNIRSLGAKSILEIKDKLIQGKSEVESPAETDAIPDKDDTYLSSEDPIEKLNLSKHSFDALTRTGIRTVGEVLELIESARLQPIRELGTECILEITEILTQVKILNDSEVENIRREDEIPGQVVRGQVQLVNKQLSRGLLHEDAIIAEKSIKTWLAEIEKIESRRVYEVLETILGASVNICEEIEFFLNQISGQCRITVLLSMYGFETKTLARTGEELGLSRERVRQIRNELKDKAATLSNLKARPALLRMQSALLIAGDLGLDITYEGWAQRIRSSGLVGDWTSQEFIGTDTVEAMVAICNLLVDCEIRWLQMPKNLQYAVQLATEGKPNVAAKILHALETLPDKVKRLINRHTKFSGGVYAKWLSQEMKMELEEVTDILQGLGYRDLSKGWFTSSPSQISSRDVFHRCLHQMFQYCGQLDIDDVCAGIRQGVSRSGLSEPEYLVSKGTVQSRSVFPVPPPDVMAEILRIGGYQSDNELYYWDGAYDEKLNKAENIIMNCLEQIGPVLHHSELVHVFIENELSLPALSATLNASPLFDKVESGLYKLRGREVTYQDIERAKAAGKPQSLRPEIEYDTNGNIIVSVTLGAIAVGSGTILCERFPDLSGANWACYVNGEEVGELNAVENEFRRLKKPFELLNCQPGDRLKFTFNTWERRVTIEKEGLDGKG